MTSKDHLDEQLNELSRSIVTDDKLVAELKTLSQEEIDHANLLKTGKNYLRSAPEQFEQADLTPEAVDGFIEEVSRLTQELENRHIGIAKSLKRIHDLEKKFEKAHLQTVVAVKDPSLKELFEALAQGDKAHVRRLKSLISEWTA